jgi:hypothetical protein
MSDLLCAAEAARRSGVVRQAINRWARIGIDVSPGYRERLRTVAVNGHNSLIIAAAELKRFLKATEHARGSGRTAFKVTGGKGKVTAGNGKVLVE